MLTRPKVGLKPTQPLSAAGMRMLPPVSVPSVPAASRATMAAPEPPLEPPGMWSSDQGLWVAPVWGLLVVVPQANSCVFVFPINTVPASRRRRAQVESAAGTRPRSTFEPPAVSMPAVS